MYVILDADAVLSKVFVVMNSEVLQNSNPTGSERAGSDLTPPHFIFCSVDFFINSVMIFVVV